MRTIPENQPTPIGGAQPGTIFLHYPCFDGLVSAAVATDVLENSRGWSVKKIRPVNYDEARTWLNTRLPNFSAVVDYLYHPDATFWADHHPTSFVNEASRLDFEERSDSHLLLYDQNSLSCAMLLFTNLSAELSDRSRYAEMAFWADKIDSANYSSVEEAIFGKQAALEINLSLADEVGASQTYCEFLLRNMRTMTLNELALLPDVRTRVEIVRDRIQRGLTLVEHSIKCDADGIAVFEARQTRQDIVNRYSAFVFFPDARYSVALVESETQSKITAMRNPWRTFESVHLGDLFKQYGGGGHRRVASALIPSKSSIDARKLFAEIIADIRDRDRSDAAPRRALA